MKRKLAAILVGDVVGSTSSMEHNEDAAVRRIAACLDAVAETVAKHEGRVFSTAGDALLAEFPSAINALRAAMASRGALAQVPDASGSDMRFGLHIADVLAVGDDLRGDGVNLASRIQTAAEPGAIDVSGTLYDNVRRNSPCIFDDLGEQDFKGISEPIQVFRVRSAIDRHRFMKAPSRNAEVKVIRPNSLAVLPLRVAESADGDQQFLAEGFTDDLTLELSRLRSIYVSSRSATNTLSSNDPVEAGKALGVRFVLSGSMRKLGNKVRLNISLCETENGGVIWSDRIQSSFDDIFDIMEDITARVAVTVSGRVEQAALAAARLKRPENMSAYEYYLRGIEQHWTCHSFVPRP